MQQNNKPDDNLQTPLEQGEGGARPTNNQQGDYENYDNAPAQPPQQHPQGPLEKYKKYIVAGLSSLLVLVVLWWLLGSGNGVVVAGKGHDEKTANNPESGTTSGEAMTPSASSDSNDGDAKPAAPTSNDGDAKPAAPTNTKGNKVGEKIVPDIAVLKMVATDYQPQLLATGVTLPIQNTIIKSAISGRIEKKLVLENNKIKAGMPIMQFATEANVARLVSAQKQLRLLQIARNSEGELSKQGLSSSLNMAKADADMAQAQAQVAELTRVVNELKVKAPFDGVVTSFMVEVGDFIGPGQPLAQFAALQQLYIQLYVSSEQVKNLKIGAAAQITIGGVQKTAVVDYIGVVSDAQTRTVEVKLKMDNSDGATKGQTPVEVTINLPMMKAYRIPPTALTLADDGGVGVKLLGQDNKVMFAPITILAQDATSIWASGLPDQVVLLTDGQAFVSAGQVINPVYKNNK